MVRRIFDALLIASFLLMLYTPVVVQLFQETLDVSVGEKRRLHTFPRLTRSRESYERFPGQFDLWLRDHFGLRRQAIVVYNNLQVRLLGTSPLPDLVALGTSYKWLYLNDYGSLHSFVRAVPFSESRLATFEKDALTAHEWCAERGIVYAWLFLPRKANVYPEYLPRWFVRRGEKSHLDIFLARMREHPEVLVLDGRPAINRAKIASADRLYLPDDSHWNSRGVYSVYPFLIEQLQKRLPQLAPVSPGRVRQVIVPGRGAELADILEMKRYYAQDIHAIEIENSEAQKVDLGRPGLAIPPRVRVTTYERPGADGVSAVVFADSFGDQFHPILAETFRRVVIVHQPDFWEELIEAERPDVVLRVNVEACLISEEEVDRYMAGGLLADADLKG